MTEHKTVKISLPVSAKLPINRCNLPAEVIGDLSFQTNPKPIEIDGVSYLHKRLFTDLDKETNSSQRAKTFDEYMRAHFRLDALYDAGYSKQLTIDRSRANYLRILRGWFFDSDSVEGAVIKSWAESRFGLIPRYHKGAIRSIEDKNYQIYIAQSSRGLYNTNAVSAQLDLLYSYCQYELSHNYTNSKTITLYRGQNRLQSMEQLQTDNAPQTADSLTVLFNNISSFTSDAYRASEFGDVVLSVEVPLEKLLFYSGLMPGIMASESEYAVIGGVYNATLVKELKG